MALIGEMSHPEVSCGMIGVLFFFGFRRETKHCENEGSLTRVFRKYRNLPSEAYFSKIGHVRNLSLPSRKKKINKMKR